MNKLKIVAEKLGYTTNLAEDDKDYVTIDFQGHWFDFNPRTDPAQLVECIEWLGEHGLVEIEKHSRWHVTYNDYDYVADTLADAVINAIAGEDDD